MSGAARTQFGGNLRRRGITLVEVLATIVMMAIVLPAAMQGISLCTSSAAVARQRSEAAALAEAKIGELIATGDWQFGGLSGDFGEAWPDYRWEGTAGAWASDPTMTELSVRVSWTSRQQEREVILTTLIYDTTSTETEPTF
jgi:type II secretory pathway pseudopilin PulG